MTLDEFNGLDAEQCKALLMTVCHSSVWVEQMLVGRPFASIEAVFSGAAEIWKQAGDADILQAFEGHAKIGDLSALRDKYSAASAEQGQVAEAQETVLQELMFLNQQYEKNNGFIFIVCATGKSAQEMLELLKKRIDNNTEDELKNGAIEQAKITQLRLQKLFSLD